MCLQISTKKIAQFFESITLKQFVVDDERGCPLYDVRQLFQALSSLVASASSQVRPGPFLADTGLGRSTETWRVRV